MKYYDRSVTEIFMDLVKIRSVSLKEKDFSEFLIDILKEYDVELFIDYESMKTSGSDAPNIIAVKKGNLDREPFGISCHIDTVFHKEEIVPVIKNNGIYSEENTILGADDKAGIALCINLLNKIQKDKLEHGDIYFIFTVGEEAGLCGAASLDFSRLKNLKNILVLDRAGIPGIITSQAPFGSEIKLIFKGKKAHSSEPEFGQDANFACCKSISKLQSGRLDNMSTFNIGIINAGLARNIISDHVEVECELRSFEKELLQSHLDNICKILNNSMTESKCELEIIIEHKYSGYKLNKESSFIKKVSKNLSKNGVGLQLIKSGGGSDANIFNAKGFQALDTSLGMREIHSSDEYILIKDLDIMDSFLIDMLS